MVFAADTRAANTVTAGPATYSVKADVNYGARLTADSCFFEHVGELPEGQERTNVKLEPAEIMVQHMRHSSVPQNWQHHGFQLEFLASAPQLDWTDNDQVRLASCFAAWTCVVLFEDRFATKTAHSGNHGGTQFLPIGTQFLPIEKPSFLSRWTKIDNSYT